MAREFNQPAEVRPAEDLAALAAAINAAHEAGEGATRQGLEHFRAAGEALIRAKAECGHGNWLPWLEASVSFSNQRASEYMRLAAGWGKLPPGGNFGLKEALAVIGTDPTRAPTESPPPRHQPMPDPREAPEPVETPEGEWEEPPYPAIRDNGSPELLNALDANSISPSAAAEIAVLPKGEQRRLLSVGVETVEAKAKELRQDRREERKEQREEAMRHAEEAGIPKGSFDIPPDPVKDIFGMSARIGQLLSGLEAKYPGSVARALSEESRRQAAESVARAIHLLDKLHRELIDVQTRS